MICRGWLFLTKLAKNFRYALGFYFIVPTHFSEGRNYILNWFFVQSTFSHQYPHCTVLWVVPLEGWSSVEFLVKRIFLNFGFSEDLRRFKHMWTLVQLPWFCLNFDQFLRKYDIFVNNNLVGFIFKDRRQLVNCLKRKFLQNYVKNVVERCRNIMKQSYSYFQYIQEVLAMWWKHIKDKPFHGCSTI